MKLTIFNCSPKPGKNNTEVMVEKFMEGFNKDKENEAEVFKLKKFDSLIEAANVFEKSEAVLIAFPLYCYSMPGGVKLFFEALEPLCGKLSGKKLAFLVQYGFREGIHARPLEKYLIKLSETLGCDYLGTIIKGSCDGLASGIGLKNRKILNGIYNIGKSFGKTGTLDKSMLNKYSKPEVEKKQSAIVMEKVIKQINKHYWGASLKKNGVSIEDSFAKPYEV